MVDFSKRLKGKPVPTKVHPVEIYNSLDRRIETGPLRPPQVTILEEWYSNRRSDRDIIIKLHTGVGKTLIGLLILQSRLNSGDGPCMYACPNKYLAKQVRNEAEKFGVPYTEITKDNDLPDDFLGSKKILITHVQKLFNGLSIFGLDNKAIKIGAIVLDDSHACIESILGALTIKVSRDHDLYSSILTLLGDAIREQGEGSFLEIESGEFETLLPIPYWTWYDKKSEITKAILRCRADVEVRFAWPILKDIIGECQAYISGQSLEISPTLLPIDSFGTFSNAVTRVLMSATTQNDSFFIKGLGFELESVRKPLVHDQQSWSGEKMVLIPSLIGETLDRNTVVNWLSKPNEKRTFGVASIVPSFRYNIQYTALKAIVTKSENIYTNVEHLKRGNYSNTIVFVNRYDGIDLPDRACRILVLDSRPYAQTLMDRYEELCRPHSDIINTRLAQKIEQGLGRSVRGEKDYSIIILVGNDLVNFVKSPLTNKYFSDQTRKQIEIGLQIAQFALEESGNQDSFSVFLDLMNQALGRDDGWKEYYYEEMSKIIKSKNSWDLSRLLKLEHDAEKKFANGRINEACAILQSICDDLLTDDKEKGWYLQQIARYHYRSSKTESNRFQVAAFLKNKQLLKPIHGIEYKKIEFVNENRVSRIRAWISTCNDYEDMILRVESILQNLTFGLRHEKFESALNELGEVIGFLAQRPDKEIKKGPDVLWCGVENQYFLFECKTEVLETRSEISKHEAGQMNSHCAWFESVYQESKCKRVLVIPVKVLSYHGDFTHDVQIMRKSTLNRLKSNVKSMFKELEQYKIHEISDRKIQELIVMHQLDIENMLQMYSESWRKGAR